MGNPLSGVLIKSGLSISRRVITEPTDAYTSQTKTLRNLMKVAEHTAFGRHYQFSRLIDSKNLIEDYAQAVPIHTYDLINDQWWQRDRNGESDVCWKGKIKYYALSSGTSGAPSKYLPISAELIKSIRLTGVKMYSCLTIFDLPMQQFSKKMLMLSGSANLKKGDSYLYGDLTGILMHNLPLWIISKYKPGIKIAAIDDYHQKMLAIAKEAPEWDIGFISGIPSWIQMMMEYIKDYNHLDNIHQIWPNLKVYAHGGTAFNPYKESISKMMGKPIYYLDTYMASEGFIAYQKNEKDNGMRLSYNSGMYYEYIPFNSQNFDQQGNLKSEAKALSIHEVTEGVDYAILLTTCAGAWRYLIGDTIRFIDVEKSLICITGRTKHFLSVCGEHLSVDNMTVALEGVQGNLNTEIREFTVYPIQIGNHFALKWYISANPMFNNEALLSSELDHQLKNVNDDYNAVRKAVMHPPIVKSLPLHVFYDFMKSKGKLGGQGKFPRVMNEVQFEEWESFLRAQNLHIETQ
jgi:hypothetical protein